jgi:hypothetical protein
MRRLIPNIVSQIAPDFSKLTRANFDNVYNAIMHLVSLTQLPYIAALTGGVAHLFNRIIMLYIHDPVHLLALLRECRSFYLDLIRLRWPTRPEPSSIPNPLALDSDWDSEANCPTIMNEAVPVWRNWSGQAGAPLLFFNRIIWALLSFDRLVIGDAPAKYGTIIDPQSTTPDKTSPLNITTDDIRDALESLGITPAAFKREFARQVRLFDFQLLNSAGPNGRQTWTAYSDAFAWSRAPVLLKTFRAWLEEAGMSIISRSMENVHRIDSEDLVRTEELTLGRLHVVQEWGLKARIVAILDYWTQMAFTPLHDTINHFLRRIPMDGTFSQDRVVEDVRVWTTQSEAAVNSFDLTAATDRIPRTLQADILNYLMDSDSFGTNWATIIAGRGFRRFGGLGKIMYGVGQPMGARSSFPMLALVHHVIIQKAAALAKTPNYVDYRVVGDDNTMLGQLTAAQYRLVMDHYGVPINDRKSVLFSAGLLQAAEICKRVFVAGEEISAFPVKLIAKVIRDGKLAPQLQNALSDRGVAFAPIDFYSFMHALVDKESFDSLVQLNLMPVEVSGLRSVITPPGSKFSDLANWYDNIRLSVSDLIHSYTYATIVEELKRLDALLRTTGLILAGMSANMFSKMVGPITTGATLPLVSTQTLRASFFTETGGASFSLNAYTADELSTLLKSSPDVPAGHPIHQAANTEVARITGLLSSLQSSDSAMVSRARLGLLDAFRNAFADIWFDKEAARGRQDRVLLQRALGHLETVAIDRAPRPGFTGKPHFIEFSTVLSTIQRNWTVSWSLGGFVNINSAHSRVNPSSVQGKVLAGSAISAVSMRRKV